MESRYSDPAHNMSECGGSSGNQAPFDQYTRYSMSFDPSERSISPSGGARSRSRGPISPRIQHKNISSSFESSPSTKILAAPVNYTPNCGPSVTPPIFDSMSPANHPTKSLRSGNSRFLPSPKFSDQTMDDAYVAFILYCNPSVPSSVNTSELRRVFRSPPRSDGKSFSVFTLWELIVKLDKKELKTWIQLATELGVEPPSAEKGQSSQKVQQYAVRLKVRQSGCSLLIND